MSEMKTRITFIRVLNGIATGPWSVRIDRSFDEHTSDKGGKFREVRQFLASLYSHVGATERSFDVLEVETLS